MSELLTLANSKIDAERAKLCASLPGQIQALKRANAAKGLLRSGNTIHGVVEICIVALDFLGRSISKEYGWAATHALFGGQAWVESLVKAVPAQLQPLHELCLAHVTGEAAAAGAPNATAQCLARLSAKVEEINTDTALSLRSGFAERKRGLVRTIAGVVPSWLTKLFGGVKP